MPRTITLLLPESMAQRYQHGAVAARKALEEFLVDRLEEVAPPLIEELPEPLRAELGAIEQLDDAELQQAAAQTLPPARERRYSRLARKAGETGLSPHEQSVLREIGDEARRLTLKRAHAYLVLNWRGHTLPHLAELSRAE